MPAQPRSAATASPSPDNTTLNSLDYAVRVTRRMVEMLRARSGCVEARSCSARVAANDRYPDAEAMR
jgi:hypothetical protein